MRPKVREAPGSGLGFAPLPGALGGCSTGALERDLLRHGVLVAKEDHDVVQILFGELREARHRRAQRIAFVVGAFADSILDLLVRPAANAGLHIGGDVSPDAGARVAGLVAGRAARFTGQGRDQGLSAGNGFGVFITAGVDGACASFAGACAGLTDGRSARDGDLAARARARRLVSAAAPVPALPGGRTPRAGALPPPPRAGRPVPPAARAPAAARVPAPARAGIGPPPAVFPRVAVGGGSG